MDTDISGIDLPFELLALSKGVRYQQWIADSVKPYLGKRIVEMGAGIGNLSRWLPLRYRLVLTEAEAKFIPVLKKAVDEKFGADSRVSVEQLSLDKDWVTSLIDAHAAGGIRGFDTVVSFNVLEHVADDERAITDFAQLLFRSDVDGPRRIISLVPAHQWAYGSLDKIFGHHRRYEAKDFHRLAAAVPRLTEGRIPAPRVHTEYFNLAGLPGWVWMGRLLKKSEIGLGAIDAFEKLCPLIRRIDAPIHRTLGLPLGQSVIGVLQWD